MAKRLLRISNERARMDEERRAERCRLLLRQKWDIALYPTQARYTVNSIYYPTDAIANDPKITDIDRLLQSELDARCYPVPSENVLYVKLHRHDSASYRTIGLTLLSLALCLYLIALNRSEAQSYFG